MTREKSEEKALHEAAAPSSECCAAAQLGQTGARGVELNGAQQF